jgi:hypothetical protein
LGNIRPISVPLVAREIKKLGDLTQMISKNYFHNTYQSFRRSQV